MALFTVRPTRLDQQTAGFVADHTTPAVEQAAGTLTWAADEHVLAALALGWWVYCRNKGAIPRRQSDHILLTTVSAAILPHIIKRVVDQERPDRLTIEGHMHGVPFSGKKYDAFPSGHALHAGALASATTVLPPNAAQLGVGGCLRLGGNARGVTCALGERCRRRICNGRCAGALHSVCDWIRSTAQGS